MDAAVGTVFPSHGLRLLSNVVHILGVSVCVFCLARRTASEDFGSVRGLQNISAAKWCVLLVFLDSWFFVALSGLLIDGVGLSVNHASCELGIVACIAFYAASKVLIYIFLIEKVYIVWNAGLTRPRTQCPIYRLCVLLLAAYAAIIVLMVLFRFAHLKGSTCVIGLRPAASIALLTYDLFVNVWLTGLFLWPLARTTLINPRLRRVAVRTLAAAAAALTTSTINIVVLAILHGKELGWICLGSCGADVTLNALVLYWVTAPAAQALEASAPPQLKTIASGPPANSKSDQRAAAAGHVGSYTDSGEVLGSDWDLDLDEPGAEHAGSQSQMSQQTHSSLSIRFALPVTYLPPSQRFTHTSPVLAEEQEPALQVQLPAPVAARRKPTKRRWEMALWLSPSSSSSSAPGPSHARHHSRTSSSISSKLARALRSPSSSPPLPPPPPRAARPRAPLPSPSRDWSLSANAGPAPAESMMTPIPPRPSRAYASKATRMLGIGADDCAGASSRHWQPSPPPPPLPPPPSPLPHNSAETIVQDPACAAWQFHYP
ncbi:hypothetical protein AURDEDRAFT_187166 [Auricularia subglabra TFB-10046 SS5]|nr:hypothetical protein AURDEDRAFT_187166 [Auricularia subglabra TFB-10046 SS5]